MAELDPPHFDSDEWDVDRLLGPEGRAVVDSAARGRAALCLSRNTCHSRALGAVSI